MLFYSSVAENAKICSYSLINCHGFMVTLSSDTSSLKSPTQVNATLKLMKGKVALFPSHHLSVCNS